MSNRERILKAARALFVERGFHQAGMAELAKASQLSVGQIYRVFTNKGDIIRTIVEEEMHKRQSAVERAIRNMELSSKPLLVTIELFVVDWFDSQDDSLSFDILAEAQRNPLVADCIIIHGPQFRQTLRSMVRFIRSDLSQPQQAMAEEFLFDLLFGMGHRQLSMPSISIKQTARGAAKMIVAAVNELAT